MKKKTSSTIICENFKIPQQTIFQDYKCSFKSGLTYFGRLYIGQEHVCFISNMFGMLKKCTIQIENIQKLQQPAKNSITIEQLQGQNVIQYNFNGFKTDHAYILIKALWKKQSIQSEVLNSHEDEQTFSMTGSEVGSEKLIDQGNVESSFFNPKAVETDKQKLCEFQLPCSVQQYYTFFLADNATVYPRKKHLQLRDSKEITITAWKKNEQLNAEVKQVNASIKVTGVPFMNYAHMSQVWQLKKNENNELFLDMATQMADVPYSNYFVVNCFLSILKDGDKKCKMIVDMSVVFNKSTYMKGKILSKTIIDMKQEYEFWFAQVKEILTKMRKSQQSQLKSSRSLKNISSDIEYETDMPLLSSEKHIHLKQIKQGSLGRESQKLDVLDRKVNKIYNILIVVLIIVVLQLIVNGVVLSSMYGNKDGQSDHNSCLKTPSMSNFSSTYVINMQTFHQTKHQKIPQSPSQQLKNQSSTQM